MEKLYKKVTLFEEYDNNININEKNLYFGLIYNFLFFLFFFHPTYYIVTSNQK
jgi:hypothetical protein